MNTKRMLELANHLRIIPHEHIDNSDIEDEKLETFNMAFFRCGSAACIAGWACGLWGSPNALNITRRAAGILDLDHEVANGLFMPRLGYFTERDYQDIEPEEAALVLEEMVNNKHRLQDELDVLAIWERVLNEHETNP